MTVLEGKKIVFLGFGNQGAAQAQNVRDSGIPNDSILVANREDHYAEDAKAKGFHVEHDFEKAAEVADSECFSPCEVMGRECANPATRSLVRVGPGSGAAARV